MGKFLTSVVALIGLASSALALYKPPYGSHTATSAYGGSHPFTVSESQGEVYWGTPPEEFDWDPTLVPPGYARGTPKTILRFYEGPPKTWSMDNEGSGHIDNGTWN